MGWADGRMFRTVALSLIAAGTAAYLRSNEIWMHYDRYAVGTFGWKILWHSMLLHVLLWFQGCCVQENIFCLEVVWFGLMQLMYDMLLSVKQHIFYNPHTCVFKKRVTCTASHDVCIVAAFLWLMRCFKHVIPASFTLPTPTACNTIEAPNFHPVSFLSLDKNVKLPCLFSRWLPFKTWI